MVRVSRNNAIPEIAVTIPPIINRTEELPVGGKPPFDSMGVKVGVKVGIGLIVGEGKGVGVRVGVAEGVADSDTCVPAAKTVNDCIIIVNIPDESLVLIVIVCSPGERVLRGRYVQFPLLSAFT